MSYNITIEFEDPPPNGVDAWENYTSNVSDMFYEALGCNLKDLNGKIVGDLKDQLALAIKRARFLALLPFCIAREE